MPLTTWRTICGISTYALVVTSPATCTRPVVTIVSTATRACGSCSSIASRMASEIWSQILSGWPSVTDSDVKRVRSLMREGLLGGKSSLALGPLRAAPGAADAVLLALDHAGVARQQPARG